MVATLRAVAGVPLTPAQWRLLLGALLPAVRLGRRASFELAVQFMISQREPFTGSTPPSVEAPPYDVEALDRALTRTALARLPNADTARVAVSDSARALARHVEQAGRDTVIAATSSDPAALGWARVPSGRENTCGFCWMLASRGPVFSSRGAAGLMDSWHDGCDCRVVAVYDADTWTGRDTYLAATARWETATAGYSGRDALNAFRRSLYADPIHVL